MNYICAFLECATIFTISVGLERERKKAGFTRILVCIAFYMLYYVLINQLFDGWRVVPPLRDKEKQVLQT